MGSWLRSETFQGFLSRRIRSRGLPAESHRKQRAVRKRQTDTHAAHCDRTPRRHRATTPHQNWTPRLCRIWEQTCGGALLRDSFTSQPNASPALHGCTHFPVHNPSGTELQNSPWKEPVREVQGAEVFPLPHPGVCAAHCPSPLHPSTWWATHAGRCLPWCGRAL